MLGNSNYTISEEEEMVKNLKFFKFPAILTPEWNAQRAAISHLNIISHQLQASKKDDYILNFFLTHEKLPVLFHELILIETWRKKVGSLIKPELIEANKKSVTAYFVHFHEGVVGNLLELYMYDKDCYLSEDTCLDYLVDLVDYCNRKLTFLVACPESHFHPQNSNQSHPKDVTEKELYEQRVKDIDFKCCFRALTIFRYLTDNLNELAPGVVNRIINTHDMAVVMVYTMERQPWKYVEKKTRTEHVLVNDKWEKVGRGKKRFKVQMHEAQAWLCLNNLLLSKESARKYEFNEFRKSQVMKLSKYLTEQVVDQIPILVELQKFLTQLQIMDPPAVNPRSFLLIEQAGMLRERIVKETDFEKVAKLHRLRILDEGTQREDLQRVARAFGGLDLLLDENHGGSKKKKFEKVQIMKK